VGKTTLALDIADSVPSVYLDLESPDDRAKLADPKLYLSRYEDRLVVLDEMHRMPELFQTLRGMIDSGRRRGRRTGRFLILGSAPMERLLGRIAYIEIGPFHVQETHSRDPKTDRLWLRGGFPDSFLAKDDRTSLLWRRDLIQSYLDGARVPAETLERLWTMLAHNQGGLLNASHLAVALMTSPQSVTRYIDLLSDLLLVRRLPPYLTNAGKRLVKSPKVYVRDSGIVHALLGIPDHNTLAGHPVVGMSWEGMVIESLLAAAPGPTLASFYRTSAGAEIDLVLEIPGKGLWAIEVKRGLTPKLQRGYHQACEDLKPDHRFVVYSGSERYKLGTKVEAIGLHEMAKVLAKL